MGGPTSFDLRKTSYSPAQKQHVTDNAALHCESQVRRRYGSEDAAQGLVGDLVYLNSQRNDAMADAMMTTCLEKEKLEHADFAEKILANMLTRALLLGGPSLLRTKVQRQVWFLTALYDNCYQRRFPAT